jgi:hypothetical protein
MAKNESATRIEERSVESSASAVEWGAIFAGGLAAMGTTAILLTLGPGLGLATFHLGRLEIPHQPALGLPLQFG